MDATYYHVAADKAQPIRLTLTLRELFVLTNHALETMGENETALAAGPHANGTTEQEWLDALAELVEVKTVLSRMKLLLALGPAIAGTTALIDCRICGGDGFVYEGTCPGCHGDGRHAPNADY